MADLVLNTITRFYFSVKFVPETQAGKKLRVDKVRELFVKPQ